MFISYNEYIEYGGGLDEAAFERYGYEAERKIQTETHGRIKTPSEAVKRCITRLTDILAKADVSKDVVSSWANDGVSESIKDVSLEEYDKKVICVIREYLSNETDENGTPLLYLGV